MPSLANEPRTDQQRTDRLQVLVIRAEIAAQHLEDLETGYPGMRPDHRRLLERELAAVAAGLRQAVEEAISGGPRAVAFEGQRLWA